VRPPLAVVALVSAVVGAVVVLLIAWAAGWIGGGHTTNRTVVVTAPAAPATGTSSTATLRDTGKPLAGNGFDPAQIFAARAPGVVTIFSFYGAPTSPNAQAAQGSGFVVTRGGLILTNAHVVTNAGEQAGGTVKPATQVYVEFDDRDRIPATIVGWDVFDDVGLIRVDPKLHSLDPVPLGNSSRVVVGQPVAAIGSPLGNEDTLTVGVVSAIHRSIPALTVQRFQLVDAIQTDAPITHGNSGGPLLDARGRVIGINAQIRTQAGTGGNAGIGFAVPIDSARRSMHDLLTSGRVAYAYVGVTTEDLTPAIAHHLGLKPLHGALVDHVTPGGPGDKAGIRGGTRSQEFEGQELTVGGDVVVAVDGIPVESADDVVRIVATRLRPGQTAAFTLVRAGVRRTVAVRLGTRPGNPGSGG
jgi:S1-C subfamily serine protease